MKWTEEDRQGLLAFKRTVDYDNIRFKEIIKQVLLDNRYIIHVLNNEKLEQANAKPDDYYKVNILPFYMIEPVQTDVQNFISYDVQFSQVSRRNDIIKVGQIMFNILCNDKTAIDKETGIARHDLLGALILDAFNWTNYFGQQIHCVADKVSTVDTHYISRSIIFEGEFTNSIHKTTNGRVKVINNPEVKSLG